MKSADYTSKLLSSLPPELLRRIDIIASREKKKSFEVLVDFLEKGANNPMILGCRC